LLPRGEKEGGKKNPFGKKVGRKPNVLKREKKREGKRTILGNKSAGKTNASPEKKRDFSWLTVQRPRRKKNLPSSNYNGKEKEKTRHNLGGLSSSRLSVLTLSPKKEGKIDTRFAATTSIFPLERF